jgi:hypothetical protein
LCDCGKAKCCRARSSQQREFLIGSHKYFSPGNWKRGTQFVIRSPRAAFEKNWIWIERRGEYVSAEAQRINGIPFLPAALAAGDAAVIYGIGLRRSGL